MLQKIKGLFYRKLPQVFMLFLADVVVFVVASYLALALRFDFGEIQANFLHNLGVALPLNILVMVIVFYFAGLYTSVWRYASVIELLSVAIACMVVDGISFVFSLVLALRMPASFYFIHCGLMLIMIGGVRFSYRILRMIVMRIQEFRGSKIRTLLVGAGEAGRMVLDGVVRGSLPDARIVCIIDDDKKRRGTKLRNIPIVGGRHKITEAVEKYKVQEIIIAIPSASKSQLSKIVTECQRTDCEIKILPSFFREMSDETSIVAQQDIRPISYEDFLGRDQIVVNVKEIANSLAGKTVLVTGGGWLYWLRALQTDC